MTETKLSPSRRQSGMANLATRLTERADTLARRSTSNELTPAVGEPTTVPAGPSDEVPAPAVEQEVSPVHVGPASPASPASPAGSAAAPTRGGKRTKEPPAATADVPTRPMAGPEGRLEASGESVVKWTLELAPQLVQALNVWERDETKRLRQRVFRERMIDLALDSIPTDLDGVLTVVGELPLELRRAPGEQFGTRVRASVREKLLGLRPELRVAGIKDIRIRDIYSAGVYRYLIQLGIVVDVVSPEPERAGNDKPRNRERER